MTNQELAQQAREQGIEVLRVDNERVYLQMNLFVSVPNEECDMFSFGLFEEGEESFGWHGQVLSTSAEGVLNEVWNWI